MPIENSVEGAVTATLDELATGQDLVISAEVPLPVAARCCARPGTQLGDVATVGGHPQAQAQCRRWLEQHLPRAAWRPASSNAEAARQAAEGQLDAALAGAFAADMYGLAVLVPDTHDHANAVTRFVVREPAGPAARGDRVGPDVAGGVPAGGPPRCPDGAAHRVRGARYQPGPHRVPAHRRRAGPGLLLHRLRRARGRRPGGRGADGPAPGSARTSGSTWAVTGRDAATHVRRGTSDAEFAQAAAWLSRLRYGRV